jgi:hypothetical protein
MKVHELEQQLNKLANPPQPQVPIEEAHLKHIRPEEREESGVDLDIVGRAARGVAETTLSPIQAQVAALRQELESYRREDQQRQLWTQLETLCPGARGVDDNSSVNGFDAWLNQPDPANPFGITYRQRAMSDITGRNLVDLAAIYKQFMQEKGITSPTNTQSQPPPQPAPAVKPRKVKGSPPPQSGKKPTYPWSQIEKFYAEWAKGSKYAGREEEAQRLNKLYTQAFFENRVDVSR